MCSKQVVNNASLVSRGKVYSWLLCKAGQGVSTVVWSMKNVALRLGHNIDMGRLESCCSFIPSCDKNMEGTSHMPGTAQISGRGSES